MKKPSHSTTRPGVPKWRVGLEDLIDPVHLRLIDECLDGGFPLAARELAQHAVQESFATAPTSYVNDRLASESERRNLAKARSFAHGKPRPEAVCDVRGCNREASVFDQDRVMFLCDVHQVRGGRR